MYSVSVEATDREVTTMDLNSLQQFPTLSATASFASQISSPGPEHRLQGDSVHEQVAQKGAGDAAIPDSVEFTAGNPRVEHITGVVHLYRDMPKQTAAVTSEQRSPDPAQPAATETLGDHDKDHDLPVGRRPMLCCLAIPADMSLADFCMWCGAYLTTIKSMRVLRREATRKVVCMVVISFVDQAHADLFYADYNLRPFSSLEPEIVCRLVYVRDVQVLTPQSHAHPQAHSHTPAAAAPAGGHAGETREPPPGFKKRVSAGSTAEDGSHQHPATYGQAAAGSSDTQGERHAGHHHSAPHSHTAAASSSGGGASGLTAGQQLLALVTGASGGGVAQHTTTIELPTCPVCLERLDEDISGVVTTVCNHQFHSDCLLKWGDTSCPVCRYCTQGHANASHCSSCNASHDLWICLICGHVGCGRYKAGHAYDHWKSHNHCYALELETQRVWDYAGDNYVHRLIQSKTDGKLVEVPTPGPARRHRHRKRQGRHSAASGRSTHTGGLGLGTRPSGFSDESYLLEEDQSEMSEMSHGDDMKEIMQLSKLEAVADEYNHLLTSQLDSQRAYFEGLLAQQAAFFQERMDALESACAAEQQAAEQASAAAKESERKRQAVAKKLADLQASHTKLTEERTFLQSLSDNLLRNQHDLKKQLETDKTLLAEKDAAIKDLEEQVRDLMVFIEAGRMVQTHEDLKDAALLPTPTVSTPTSSGSGGKPRSGGSRSKGK